MSAASVKIPSRPQTQRLRAIVVDDSQAARQALCAYVERNKQFVVVATARDGCEALQCANACAPDLVVIDFDMPKMNGIEAARTLLSKFPSLAIVVVSLHDTAELRRLCREVGARAFVCRERLSEELPAILRQIHRTLTR